jgi:hypothetical protein
MIGQGNRADFQSAPPGEWQGRWRVRHPLLAHPLAHPLAHLEAGGASYCPLRFARYGDTLRRKSAPGGLPVKP